MARCVRAAAWLVVCVVGVACEAGEDDTGGDSDQLLNPDEQTPETCTIDASPTGSSGALILIDTDGQTVSCNNTGGFDDGLQISAYSGDDTWSFSTNVPEAVIEDCGGYEYYSSTYGQAAYEAWVSCNYVAADSGELVLTFRVVVVDIYTNEVQVFEGRGVAPDTGNSSD